MNSISQILTQATQSPLGIALQCRNTRDAHIQRRKFYAEREKLRARGVSSYNELSFLLRPNGELWLVRRAAIPARTTAIDTAEIRALHSQELPSQIASRGKSRVGRNLGIS